MNKFIKISYLKIVLSVFFLSLSIQQIKANNEKYYDSEPTVNAPTPPVREALDVISIFSDAYNNIAGANYNPDWHSKY